MKKSKFLLPCVVCAATAMIMLLSSCSKDGSKGDTGPAGPAGAAGAAGAAGQNGNANVIASGWLDVIYDPIKDTAVDLSVDTVAWVSFIPAAELTAARLSNSEIKVYMNVGTAADPAVFPLPLNDVYAFTGVLNINLYFIEGEIELYSTDDASTFIPSGTAKAWQYRYVIIPPANGRTASAASAIDWNNYAAVKAYLHLKD